MTLAPADSSFSAGANSVLPPAAPNPAPEPAPDVRMRWDNLLFLHWPVAPQALSPLLPPGLEIDTFGGDAFVALVPFRMEATRFRGIPNLPGLGSFYECNVRTYVKVGPLKAVWFLSLDAERLLPVLGGRWLWNLNYIHSAFTVRQHGDRTDYTLRRDRGLWPLRSTGGPGLGAASHIIWQPGAPLPLAQPGSIEHFLTERYWLTTYRFGKLMAGRILHKPWPLQAATVESLQDELLPATGLPLGPIMPAYHSSSLDVIGWKLTPIAAAVNRAQRVGDRA